VKGIREGFLAEEKITSFDGGSCEEASSTRIRHLHSDRADICGVVELRWNTLCCLALHALELILAFLLFGKSCIGAAKLALRDGILWKLFGEDLVCFAALSKPSKMVESLRLAEKGFLERFWVYRLYVEVTKRGFELVGTKGGKGTVESDRDDFLSGRG
jgi:hypothetical protein